jgi:predicted AlkP superfamily phosphohydrolase/phosphomutase/tetratricopeptide (TPR) repeat protein
MTKKRLLLVGWDSADWKLINPLMDAGALPTLEKLVNSGTSGNLTTLEPQLSPMLWTSIATGKMAYHHGVPGFTEVDPQSGAIVPVSAATRKCTTVWEMLAEKGLKSHIVSWFATQGEQNIPGKMVSNMYCHVPNVPKDSDPLSWPPPPPGTYWPEELAELLNEDRVSLHDIDPDYVLRLFVPNGHQVDQSKDQRLSALAKRLSEAFSAHNAAVRLMEIDPEWDFFAVYYRTIDEICHQFMHYHPPKMDGIPEEDFEMYKEVVNGAYRMHDLMLKRLLELAGPDTSVMLVSDHGFHSDHLRPKFTPRVPAGITVWHRPQGVFVASGEGFFKDELVFGARLLDITPSILHYFGLPIGQDMEGRVLEDVFSEQRTVETIPTWEPAVGTERPRAKLDEQENRALLDQFVALGYIDEIPEDNSVAIAETNRENDWNMARAYMYAQKYEQALPLLERCLHAQPFRPDYAQMLANCQLQLNMLEEADQTIDRARDHFGRTENADLIKASIAIEREDFATALELLEGVKDKLPQEVQIQLFMARCYAALRRWDDGLAAVDRVLSADPDNPQAFLVRTRIELHQNKALDAVDSALAAIGLQYGNPIGHYLLGTSLLQLNKLREAEKALNNCHRLAPNFLPALRMLARVYHRLGDMPQFTATENLRTQTAAKMRDSAQKELARLRALAAERQADRDDIDRQKQAEIDRKEAEIAAIEPLEILIVSGLPRSGTSLMMQMLKAAGIEPMTDGKRTADDDNPEGYWEWEEIKLLPKNPRIIEQTKGKVVKVISALLPSLPRPHRYKIIYMVRPTTQVVDSQLVMLDRQGQKARSEKQHLIDVQEAHSRQIRQVLAKSDRVDLLEVSYPDLVADPGPVIEQLRVFLGENFQDSELVSACVKPKLFRNR